jgi:hypothetical protein
MAPQPDRTPRYTLIVLNDHWLLLLGSSAFTGRFLPKVSHVVAAEPFRSSDEMNDKIKALGKPCYLGQLYDAKMSFLLPGLSLFKLGDRH